MSLVINGQELWQYVTIPLFAAIVGWFTNWLALQMTFYPIEFVGIKLYQPKDSPLGFIGWQGIIPTKAEKMATKCFELMTQRLFDVKEVFERLNPTRFSEVMEKGLLLLMDDIINETALEFMPTAWASLPQEVRDEAVVLADKESPKFLSSFMSDLQEHVEDVLDIKHMTVSACVKHKALINKIFQECGEKEFVFIIRSGFYFGFLFGLVQMIIWFFYKANWIMPVAGFIVGYATNWLALKCIFCPLKPIKMCNDKIVIQGLFLKRQHEVSETFSRVICNDILHVKAMWDAILTGPYHKNFHAMLRVHSIVFTENLVGGLKPIAIAAMGAQQFGDMKEAIAAKVMNKLPTIIDQSYEYTNEALDMEATIREKMQGLSSKDFEGVLHPAFEEDEFTLILVGAILGLIVGIIQLFLVF